MYGISAPQHKVIAAHNNKKYLLKDRPHGSFAEWKLNNPANALSMLPRSHPIKKIAYSIGCYKTTIINHNV
jgi:hypothetical protein